MSDPGGPTDEELWGPTGAPGAGSPPPPPTTDPTLMSPVIQPAGGDGGSKRPAWLLPSAAGLLVGLLVALLAFAILRGGDDELAVSSTTSPAEISVSSTVPATTLPEATTSIAPATSAAPSTTPATSATTTTPATTTTATTTTIQPTTTVAPSGIPTASPGTVRIIDQEFPILRACSSPSSGFGFSTVSYLFDNGGFVDIVERWFDEGSTSGFYGDTYDLVDLGGDGFGFFFVEGDAEVPISVNPGAGDLAPCPGTVELTDPTNPEFPTSLGVVDICFGTSGPDDRFGYRARLSEGAEFVAAPNAGASLAVSISTLDFAGDDPDATSSGPASGEAISGTAVANPNGVYAGQSRDFEASWGGDVVRDCVEGFD